MSLNSQQTKDAIIIDPGLDFSSEAQRIFDYISKGALNVSYCQYSRTPDHTNGDAIFQEKYNVPIYIHKYDVPFIEGFKKYRFLNPVILEDGSMIEFGDES